jgi:DNA-binding transcriptional MerR regulator
MYRFGPYGPNHSTAGTFAFKRALLKQTRYEDDALLAEEKHFLKDYTIPFVQLNPIKTILVFSHEQNTFDKRRLIDPNNKFCSESNLKVNNFIKSEEMRNFYVSEIQELLKNYEPGHISHKQDVLDEIKRRDTEMRQRPLTQMELLEALRNKTEECSTLKDQLSRLLTVIKQKNLQSHFI